MILVSEGAADILAAMDPAVAALLLAALEIEYASPIVFAMDEGDADAI
jgi:flagellar motility protein MotE (MotC chaperone)